MKQAPSLVSLCMGAINDELLRGEDDLMACIYELPADLFDVLLTRLPPLSLHKLQNAMPRWKWDDSECEGSEDCFRSCRKRRRSGNFDNAWRSLFKLRWAELVDQMKPTDWQQAYWETHLQNCLDEAAEIALLPSFHGEIGNITISVKLDLEDIKLREFLFSDLHNLKIPLSGLMEIGSESVFTHDSILKYLGDERLIDSSTSNFSKLYQHCHLFGHYLRSLRIQNVLCIEETCFWCQPLGGIKVPPDFRHSDLDGEMHLNNILQLKTAVSSQNLLEKSKLESLVLRWIKTKEHVDGLSKLILQNRGTLKLLEFIHCKLPSTSISAICGLLHAEDMQSHGIEHFSIHSSSFLDSYQVVPLEFSSFLASGRCLRSLKLCDVHLDKNLAQLVFDTLLEASSNLSILDVSDNEIAGWLSSFNRRYQGSHISPSGADRSLRSLTELNLRGNNLHKEDADNLRYALVHMPALQKLDLSENPIGDDGVRHLITFLSGASGKGLPLAELNLENCEISANGVAEFLSTLSTLDLPLSSLSIADNNLGSHVAEALVEFLGTSIQFLNIGGVGLGSSGFQELQKVASKSLRLSMIDISKNRGGIESAKFLSKLIECAPQLVTINAAYNLMPPESINVIDAALRFARGNLRLLDLRGNNLDKLATSASILFEFQHKGTLQVVFDSFPTSDTLHDDDP